MIIAKDAIKRFPLISKMLNEISVGIICKAVDSEDGIITLTFAVIPQLSEMEISDPLHIKFI